MSAAGFILASRLGLLGARLGLRIEPQQKMLAVRVGCDGADPQEKVEAPVGALATFGEAGGTAVAASAALGAGCRGHESSALDMGGTVPAPVATGTRSGCAIFRRNPA